MKRRSYSDELGLALVRFFQNYLPTLRGMSRHTIHSYRDTLVLLLRFLSAKRHCGIERLDLAAITADSVGQFLTSLEQNRNNGIATRNTRLAAIHTFARFLASERPEHLAASQAILGIPFKRGARSAPIEYLEPDEVEALLKAVDRGTAAGRRDYALLSLMFNTGARVQEVLDLRLCDLRVQRPCQTDCKARGTRCASARSGRRLPGCCSDLLKNARIPLTRMRHCLSTIAARSLPASGLVTCFASIWSRPKRSYLASGRNASTRTRLGIRLRSAC